MDIEQKWLIIVNPNAGIKKSAREWPHILHCLKEEGFSEDYVYTECKFHAIKLTQEGIRKGYRKILVVGGDGTLNEVLNGIFTQTLVPPLELTLGMIPVGTGNDWGRSYEIPFDYKKAIQVIKREKTAIQDVGKVTYFKDSEKFTRFFMNVAGMGYDALVAKKTNLMKEKGHGGPLTYFYFVFASLFQYRFMEIVLEVDGKQVFKGEIFSMNVGICKYNGGGMKQVPFAEPDDGLLDITLIVKAPKYLVLRYAPRLYNGTLLDLPFVKSFRGKQIRIRSTGRIFLETDGESLGHSPLNYEILPLALKVVTGKPDAQ
ncbi:MAG: diacylglycerol kinase family lipid kinase [Bacteroidota bacterium]|nr:diacylglycerol kinase family lipid kinase [Bacteroidota bacterium]